MMQSLLVALVVAACAGYVVWRLLLPQKARRRILQALGRQPAAARGGCGGCDGCGDARAAAEGPSTHKVHWLPRN